MKKSFNRALRVRAILIEALARNTFSQLRATKIATEYRGAISRQIC
jgi:hypothetical protein